MKYLITCLTILGTATAWAEVQGDVTPTVPETASKISAISQSAPTCPKFVYPAELSDGKIYKRTIGKLNDEKFIAAAHEISGPGFNFVKVSSDVNIGLITNEYGCKELVSFVSILGMRHSDNCVETIAITVRDQTIASNQDKMEVVQQLRCPRKAYHGQSAQQSPY